MSDRLKLRRRDFLKDTAMGVASVFLWRGNCDFSPFTDSERSCVIALAEQIIPRDEFAGATDVGVINYIENWLTLYYPERLSFYKYCLSLLQAACVKLYANEFQSLDFSRQKAFLEKAEKGKVAYEPWSAEAQREFFGEILERSMQGFYGNPRHGGNSDFAAYRMMNLDSPLVIGQNRYKNV